jgi:hypothetical protein
MQAEQASNKKVGNKQQINKRLLRYFKIAFRQKTAFAYENICVHDLELSR